MTKKKHKLVENFHLYLFTLLYSLSCLFIFVILLYFLKDIFGSFIILAGMIFIVLSIVGWAYLFVFFSIPNRMAELFDPIKNSVSSGKVKTLEQFGNELNLFLLSFFNYSFISIEHSAFKAKNGDFAYSSKSIISSFNFGSIEKDAKNDSSTSYYGKIKIDNASLNIYSIPIYFQSDYLGCFVVFSRQKLGKLRMKFLTDLEEYYIDDLLISLLSKK